MRSSGLRAALRFTAMSTVGPAGSLQSRGTSIEAHSKPSHSRQVTFCW